MSKLDHLQHKLFTAPWNKHQDEVSQWVSGLSRPLAFTNGCFDILHRGHIVYLSQAADLGGSLLVAVNDDASVRAQNKGKDRPLNPLQDRMMLLAALESVDAVISFGEDTPLNLINLVRPEILVKGGDWPADQIVGSTEVESWGGSVHSIPFVAGHSTTGLLNRIRSSA
ncbi:MAG: D-glycero-beta-D-manno-heptose 1-phosphate adenylyltransferase [bacterium]